MYFVYNIEYKNKIIYVGYTKDIIKREKQHIYLCYKQNNKSYNKQLYVYIRKEYSDKEQGKNIIKLNKIKEFKTKVEAKRYEMFLILTDYYNKKQLLQKIPNISDR